MNARRLFRSERGSAVVELPFAICIILMLGMGAITLVQVIWTHMTLSSAVRTATRYATHVDYDPTSDDPMARHRAIDEVTEWVLAVAKEADIALEDVTVEGTHYPCGPAWNPGTTTTTTTEPTTTTTESTTTTTAPSEEPTETTLLPPPPEETDPILEETDPLLDDVQLISFESAQEDLTTTEDPTLPVLIPETSCDPVSRSIDQLVAGDVITITVNKKVSNPLYAITSAVTNTASELFGGGVVFDPAGIDISAGATSYVE